eukprot:SAG31_NODE_849_length_11529_cov_3.342257_2_plen_170_part_00
MYGEQAVCCAPEVRKSVLRRSRRVMACCASRTSKQRGRGSAAGASPSATPARSTTATSSSAAGSSGGGGSGRGSSSLADISATAPDGKPLPAGWMAKRATSGAKETYYVNVASGESQWELPTGPDDPVRKIFDRMDAGGKGYLDTADVKRLVNSVGYECSDSASPRLRN